MEQKFAGYPHIQKKGKPFFAARRGGKESFFQPKLMVGPGDDVYEKEADAVADHIMRASDPQPMLHQTTSNSPVQYAGAADEREEDVQRKESTPSAAAAEKNQTLSFIPVLPSTRTPQTIQRQVKVDPAVDLDTMGFNVVRTGDTYTTNNLTKDSAWNELISSLFFSPRTFRLQGSNSAEANRNFRAHLKARYDIITFASRRQYRFGAGAGFTMNAEFWVIHPDGTFDVKPGVNPQKARDDLNKHPEAYAIACEAATKLTMLGGSKSEALRGDYGNADDEWIPGDWGWIKNVNYPATGGIPGQEGENLIYVGKDIFWGHTSSPNPYNTYDLWFEKVKSWNGDAKLQDWRNYPINGLV